MLAACASVKSGFPARNVRDSLVRRAYNRRMQNLLHNLNPEQLAAVTLPPQHALILAGALVCVLDPARG